MVCNEKQLARGDLTCFVLPQLGSAPRQRAISLGADAEDQVWAQEPGVPGHSQRLSIPPARAPAHTCPAHSGLPRPNGPHCRWARFKMRVRPTRPDSAHSVHDSHITVTVNRRGVRVRIARRPSAFN